MLKVIKAFPPNWNALTKVFPIKGKQGIVYAWGALLYNPSGIAIPPWVLEHEAIHCERQKLMGIGDWWDAYIRDPDFRLNEEVLAHQREWLFFANGHGIRDNQRYLEIMAKRLSSPLYGSLITEAEAYEAIQCLGEWSGKHNDERYPNYRDE